MVWADQGLHLQDQTFTIVSEGCLRAKDQAVGAALGVSCLTWYISIGETVVGDTKLSFEDT